MPYLDETDNLPRGHYSTILRYEPNPGDLDDDEMPPFPDSQTYEQWHRGIKFEIMNDFTGYSCKIHIPSPLPPLWSKPFLEEGTAIAEAKLVIDNFFDKEVAA